MEAIEYAEPEKGLGGQCEAVLRSLPEWFGREDSIQMYAEDIESLDTYTARLKGEVIGFFSVKIHNESSAELYVLAIKPEFHGQGIGTKLYEKVETDLKVQSIRFVQVKTLSPTAKDPNYEKTRLFYLALGFLPLEDFPDFWGDDTPCLQMIKSVG